MTADPASGLSDLEHAEAIADQFERASLVTEEAVLLRGCLLALIAIGRHLYASGDPT
ncbi:MAG: hypothetical protein HOV73_01900 [Streptomyces sp.]|nr:hypothetical protein [Streptomyces sp.]